MLRNATQQLSGVLAERYEVSGKLGAGGMATAYLARDRRLSMDVVIKVPRASLLDDPTFAKRFEREIRALVQLAHPHVCRVLDVGEEHGLPFAVLQYLAGGSLESRRPAGSDGRPHAMAVESLSGWLPQIAQALDYVHNRGYVHRDVKPGNILFDEHGYAYLSDFGIAKVASDLEVARQSQALTGTGLVMGTLEYMAPELLLGNAVDGRIDQYALAVTVFELLTGRHPFQSTAPAAIILQQTTAVPPDVRSLAPAVPRGPADAIARALSKKCEGRFASCQEFASALLVGVNGISSSSQRGATDVPLSRQTKSISTAALQTIAVQRPNCPKCGKSLKLGDTSLGKRARCPNCRTPLTVIDAPDALKGTTQASRLRRRAFLLFAVAIVLLAGGVPIAWQLLSTSAREEAGLPVTSPRPAAPTASTANTKGSPFPSGAAAMADAPVDATVPSSPTDPSPSPAPAPGRSVVPVASIEHDGLTITAFQIGDASEVQVHSAKGALAWSAPFKGTSPVETLEVTDRLRVIRRDGTVHFFDVRTGKNLGQGQISTGVPNSSASPLRIPFMATVAREVQQNAASALQEQVVKTNSIGMELVLIPPGMFVMGSPTTEPGRVADEYQVDVNLTQPFRIAKTEITQQQWHRVMNSMPWKGQPEVREGSDYPAVFVNWDDAREFCRRLSAAEGSTYRLPTEAEWEWACRSGSAARFSCGDDDRELQQYAWFGLIAGQSAYRNEQYAHLVGQKLPNAFGLYDMHGNVWEWCEDTWRSRLRGGTDPLVTGGSSFRILRGATWGNTWEYCRSALRGRSSPSERTCNSGFRPVLVVAQ
jgi:formylglycine-generating enzyme required for sulfatase activity/serine/threonine protein kinase